MAIPPLENESKTRPPLVLTESRYILIPIGEGGDFYRIDKKTGEIVIIHVGVGPKTIDTVGKAIDMINTAKGIDEFNEVKMAAAKSIVTAINKFETTLEKGNKPIENRA